MNIGCGDVVISKTKSAPVTAGTQNKKKNKNNKNEKKNDDLKFENGFFYTRTGKKSVDSVGLKIASLNKKRFDSTRKCRKPRTINGHKINKKNP